MSLSYIDDKYIDEKELAKNEEEPPATLILEPGYSYRYPLKKKPGIYEPSVNKVSESNVWINRQDKRHIEDGVVPYRFWLNTPMVALSFSPAYASPRGPKDELRDVVSSFAKKYNKGPSALEVAMMKMKRQDSENARRSGGGALTTTTKTVQTRVDGHVVAEEEVEVAVEASVGRAAQKAVETMQTLEEVGYVERHFMRRIKRVLLVVDCTLMSENEYSNGLQEILVGKLLDIERRYKKHYPALT